MPPLGLVTVRHRHLPVAMHCLLSVPGGWPNDQSRDTLSCMRSSRRRAGGGTPSQNRGAPGGALPGPRSFHGPAHPAFASSPITSLPLNRRPLSLSRRDPLLSGVELVDESTTSHSLGRHRVPRVPRGLQPRPGRQLTEVHVAPERDQELARQRDDPNPPQPRTRRAVGPPVPLTEGALRLV